MVIPFPEIKHGSQLRFAGFDPIPWAVQESESGQATFIDECLTADTLDRVMTLWKEAEDQAVKWSAIASAMLDRADRITGQAS